MMACAPAPQVGEQLVPQPGPVGVARHVAVDPGGRPVDIAATYENMGAFADAVQSLNMKLNKKVGVHTEDPMHATLVHTAAQTGAAVAICVAHNTTAAVPAAAPATVTPAHQP